MIAQERGVPDPRTDPLYASAGIHLPARPLRIGIFDDFVRGTAGVESLIGATTPLPSYVQYRDWCSDPSRVDCVVSTVRDSLGAIERRKTQAIELASVRRADVPWITFLQECREIYPHPSLDILHQFDLVLTNDLTLCRRLPRARWCSLIGTQLTLPAPRPYEKRKLVSLLDSGKRVTEGHKIRLELGQHSVVDWYGHGGKLGFVSDKWSALGPYFFNIAVENAAYAAWNTEKLIDCFIAKTVPIYWGSLDMIEALGFDLSGMIPFSDKGQAEGLLSRLPMECMRLYEPRTAAIEHNHRRALQLTAPEVLVDALIRREFHISEAS